jgi:hypothetical protein
MIITKENVKEKILQYLNRTITIDELVDWAEKTIQEGEYDNKDFDKLRDIIGRIGLADVKEFGLTWDDCYNFLSSLGYHIELAVK